MRRAKSASASGKRMNVSWLPCTESPRCLMRPERTCSAKNDTVLVGVVNHLERRVFVHDSVLGANDRQAHGDEAECGKLDVLETEILHDRLLPQRA